MNTRIDSPSPLPQTGLRTESTDSLQQVEGEFQGRQVVLLDAESMVADAAEELTFAASETVEKKLSKRKVGDKERGLKTNAMERAEQYLKKIPEALREEKISSFIESLKKSGRPSPQQIRNQLSQLFKDVSDQYAALAYAHEMLSQEDPPDEALLKALDAAIRESMDEDGPSIRAGLNISLSAVEFSEKGLGEIQNLRDFYRNLVLRHEGLGPILKSIGDHFKNQEFSTTLEFLIKSVGMDLQSEGPSISPVELKKIMDDLYSLEALRNLNMACAQLVTKLRTQFGQARHADPQVLLQNIVELKEQQWIRDDHIRPIMEKMDVQDLEAQIYFLRELKEVVRQIPLKAFENLDNREKFIQAVQNMLDIAIEKEEEALG